MVETLDSFSAMSHQPSAKPIRLLGGGRALKFLHG